MNDRLAELIGHIEQDPAFDVDGFLAKHPAEANELRAALAKLRSVGMIDSPDERSVGREQSVVRFDEALDAGDATPAPQDESDESTVTKPGPALPQLSRTRLRALEKIGEGGMGTVYRAVDDEVGREVALKIVRADKLGESREIVDRFLREARITGQLEHPGIVPVHQVGLAEQGGVYYTMKLIRGRTLASLIEETFGAAAPSPTTETSLAARLEIMLRVCDALAFAHSRGVVHRDLKPSNIMIGPFGETQVMDWGLAKVLSADEASDTGSSSTAILDESDSPTVSGDVFGTPAHMAPEQARGAADEIDARTDVFGLGSVLYAVLTGRPPYATGGRKERLEAARNAAVHDPEMRDAPTPVPRELRAICRKALAREKRDRYETASALGDDLRAYLESGPGTAWRDGPLAKIVKAVRRHPTRAVMAVAAVVLAALGVVIYATQNELSRLTLERELERAGQLSERERRAQAHYNLGRAYRLLGQRDRAISHLEEAISTDENFIYAHNDLGLLYGRTGEPDKALVHFLRVRELDQKLPAVYANLGWIYGKKKQFADAINSYKQALAFDANDIEARCALAELYAERRDVDGARAEIAKAESLSPETARDYHSIGRALLRLDRLDEATDRFKKAIGVDKTFTRAWVSLGEVHWRKRDPHGQLRILTDAADVNPTSSFVHSLRGDALWRLREKDQARNAYKWAIQLNASNAEALNGLGLLLQGDGQLEEAEQLYEKALEAKRDYHWPYYNLANIANARGQYAKQLMFLKKADALHPGLYEVEWGFAVASYLELDLETSLEHYQRAARTRRGRADARLRCFVGFAKYRMGNFEGALADVVAGDRAGRKRKNWSPPSRDWIRELEKTIELRDVIYGLREPANEDERLQLAIASARQMEYRRAVGIIEPWFQSVTQRGSQALIPTTRLYVFASAAAQLADSRGMRHLPFESVVAKDGKRRYRKPLDKIVKIDKLSAADRDRYATLALDILEHDLALREKRLAAGADEETRRHRRHFRYLATKDYAILGRPPADAPWKARVDQYFAKIKKLRREPTPDASSKKRPTK